MQDQLTKCPDCNGPLPSVHDVEEKCQYCGARIVFGRSTLPSPKKEDVSQPERQQVKAHPPVSYSGSRSFTPDKELMDSGKYYLQFFVTLGCTIAVALVLYLVGLLSSFTVGEKSQQTDPINRIVAPSAVVIEVSIQPQQFITSWLSSIETVELRKQSNVVNFVLFHDDQIIYAATQTFELTDEWKNERPYFVEALSIVNKTGVVIQVNGKQYNFNIYQPMTWKSVPNIIFMVDRDGKIWVFNTEKGEPSPIPLENYSLPIEVLPNPNLEIGINK